MSGIGIITNPYSKLNKRDPSRTKLLGYILGEQGRLELTKSLDELQRVAYKFKQSGISTLAINGGDGTIARTLTAFIKAYGDEPMPRVALLRGGTMNVLANNLGLKGTPEGLLFRLLEAMSSPDAIKTKSVRTLCVDGNYGFLYADGISCTVLSEFYKNKTSALGAVWLVTRLCTSAMFKGEMFRRLIKAQEVNVTPVPGQAMRQRSCGIMAATIERMPMGPRLFPLTQKFPDKFQYFNITSPEEKLIWQLPLILVQNGIMVSSYKTSGCCEKLIVSADQAYTYSLDGEIYQAEHSNQLELSLGPKIDFVLI